MRVHNLKTLREFWERHTDAKGALQTWYKMVCKEEWGCFNDVRKRFGTADVIPGNRAVFNIKGNKYRLVLKINYDWKIVYIRFIGSHVEYDKTNVESI
ncbi:MAG: type II toxin-antitoxin system HigB family toxin [Verrucomicrobiota bacterium]